MLLPDLTSVLAAVPPEAIQDDYRVAIIEDNVLGKKTLNSRQRSFRYLRELYALDARIVLFRALRDLWPADSAAQPLLALLSSLARDPALRATSSAVLPLAPGASVTAGDLANALMDRYPGNYSSAVAHKVGRNAGSSWTQSGHLVGRTGKRRAQVACRPPVAAYALLLGHLEGAAGEALFDTLWARVLDAPIGVLHEQAFAASQRGWIEFRHGGGVTDVGFTLLTRELAQKAVS
jgi:hypothetical protein